MYHGKHGLYESTPAGIFTATRDDEPDKVEHVTQVLVNEYRTRIGIASHTDNPAAFGKVLVMISMGDAVHMRLLHPVTNRTCTFLLEPRSLLVLKGESRYAWQHGISRHRWVLVPTQHNADGTVDSQHVQMFERDDQFRRVSLTVRHLLPSRKQVTQDDLSDRHAR